MTFLRNSCRQPADRFVADFIGETNFLVGRVSEIRAGGTTVLVDGALEVRIPATADVVAGQQVTVAIRPEKMSLHAAPPDPLALPGMVEEVIYIGTDTRYLVRLTEQTTVVVREQNLGATATIRFCGGEPVYVSWTPGSARLLVG